MEPRLSASDRLRSFVFGVEDSLVSTVGLVSGIASVGLPKATILLTGTILIFVEAFSMAVGSLLSENSAHEFRTRTEIPLRKSFISAGIMFFSYFLSGFVVIAPYLIFVSVADAFLYSIIISLCALFVLGGISARFSGLSVLKKGLTMTLVGGSAIAIGVIVGSVIQTL
ncbi:MAG: hypothetical protein RJA61_351 [Candidatus Parcubacteria bacterium]|jgi:VIT1/CCC1 family predicted Fe2+/Mn2+ transporter